jgi:hypothetical protein
MALISDISITLYVGLSEMERCDIEGSCAHQFSK